MSALPTTTRAQVVNALPRHESERRAKGRPAHRRSRVAALAPSVASCKWCLVQLRYFPRSSSSLADARLSDGVEVPPPVLPLPLGVAHEEAQIALVSRSRFRACTLSSCALGRNPLPLYLAPSASATSRLVIDAEEQESGVGERAQVGSWRRPARA